MRILKPKDLASQYGIPVSTSARLRAEGTGPAFFKRGRAVLYDVQDVEAWLNARRVTSNAEAYAKAEAAHA